MHDDAAAAALATSKNAIVVIIDQQAHKKYNSIEWESLDIVRPTKRSMYRENESEKNMGEKTEDFWNSVNSVYRCCSHGW